MSVKYKIHPAIGIARVGDSDEYYIAPETAGARPSEYSNPVNAGHFRDQENKLLKQAARFKVYRYEDGDTVGEEVVIGQGGISQIEWTAWVANKKPVWYQFKQQTGSGMGPYPASNQPDFNSEYPYAMVNDPGYETNNVYNPGTYDPNTDTYNPTYPNRPYNPLRYNLELGLTPEPGNGPLVRQRTILDPGKKILNGANQQQEFTLDPNQYRYLGALVPSPISRLGTAMTDGSGNLVILGGDGNSGTNSLTGVKITAYANNQGWFDDISDGPVTARLYIDGEGWVEVDQSAWVTVAPPAYAPEIINQVNMYDNMLDVFIREYGARPDVYTNGAFVETYEPSYPDEILPILQRPPIYQYVAAIPGRGLKFHGDLPNDDPQEFFADVYPYLRGRGDQYFTTALPGPAENVPHLMPWLAGDNPISNETMSKYLGLTETQYFFLSQYAQGRFTKNSLPADGPGVGIDKGNLENCVGGAFTPGIEITWITRNKDIYSVPGGTVGSPSDMFRIKTKPVSSLSQYNLDPLNGQDNEYVDGLEPGDLSKYMAQPWQSDFNECSIQNISNDGLNDPRNPPVNYWWWPAQRPYSVFPSENPSQQLQWTRDFVEDIKGNNLSDIQMTVCWKYLGFVVKVQDEEPQYQEIERQSDAIKNYQNPPGTVTTPEDSELGAKPPIWQGKTPV